MLIIHTPSIYYINYILVTNNKMTGMMPQTNNKFMNSQLIGKIYKLTLNLNIHILYPSAWKRIFSNVYTNIRRNKKQQK